MQAFPPLSPGIKYAALNQWGAWASGKTNPPIRAFIAKLGWKVLTEDNSLCVKLVRNKYLKDRNLFPYKAKTTDSPIWKHILNERDLIRKRIRWKIENGKNISFWDDNWALQTSLSKCPHIITNGRDNNLCVADFILPSKH